MIWEQTLCRTIYLLRHTGTYRKLYKNTSRQGTFCYKNQLKLLPGTVNSCLRKQLFLTLDSFIESQKLRNVTPKRIFDFSTVHVAYLLFCDFIAFFTPPCSLPICPINLHFLFFVFLYIFSANKKVLYMLEQKQNTLGKSKRGRPICIGPYRIRFYLYSTKITCKEHM